MTVSVAQAREQLAQARAITAGTHSSTTGARDFYNPARVLVLAEQLLAAGSSHSVPAAERFAVREQAFLAALDTGRFAEAKTHLDALDEAFPAGQSLRVQRLYAQYHEALGASSLAFNLYAEALKKDEANMALWKRSIAQFISIGKRLEAIEGLVVYTDRFMQDAEAWSMLAKLYAEDAKFQQAAFCYEEIMLIKPCDPHIHVRYADVVASLGRWNLAVKYYASALDLLEDHARSLYGLHVVTGLLKARYASGKNDVKVRQVSSTSSTQDIDPIPLEIVSKLHDLAAERLSKLYEKKAGKKSEVLAVFKAWLQSSSSSSSK
eukprot:jgi/Hompol1/1110/HPOL_005526-RA